VKVYISGPISGRPNGNREEFFGASLVLVMHGHDPVNPHEILCPVEHPTWADYMRADLKVLLDCDAIAMLPGWWRSGGARLEWFLARVLGIKIMKIQVEKC
jgi:hypothetical protein